MTSLSALNRNSVRKALESELFDLVIVGGGINGAGVAREACLRGMKVALLEAHDFASGTSSKSSKLLHGGIRYLENFEFGLVFEALAERNLLLELVPHLAHPLRFMIPVFQSSRVPFWKLGLGMWLYDALALFQAPELHERLSKSETMKRAPLLQADSLTGSFVYSDAYMDDERLVFETLRSADRTGLFWALPQARVKARERTEFGVRLGVRDEVLQEEFEIRARHMVGALGPWTDAAGSQLHGNWKPVLRPTKGVHLTFSRERFPLPCAVVMAVEDRIVFAIPRHEMVIVGTTDTDEAKLPEEVHVQSEDVKYLLGVTAKYFPQAKLTSRDVVSCYVGVRPLVRDEAGTAGKTSREHQIWTLDQATYVCGGKYTTYRRMSEQVVDSALKHFPLEEQARFANSHSRQALNPRITAEAYRRRFEIREELLSFFSDEEALVEAFLDRFGHECLDFMKKYPKARSVAAIEAEIAIDTSACRHLKDFFFRRVPWVLSRPDHGLAFLEAVADVFKRRFGWNAEQMDQEIAELRSLLQQEHRVLSLEFLD